jgi:hypothetical protein
VVALGTENVRKINALTLALHNEKKKIRRIKYKLHQIDNQPMMWYFSKAVGEK